MPIGIGDNEPLFIVPESQISPPLNPLQEETKIQTVVGHLFHDTIEEPAIQNHDNKEVTSKDHSHNLPLKTKQEAALTHEEGSETQMKEILAQKEEQLEDTADQGAEEAETEILNDASEKWTKILEQFYKTKKV